MLWIAIVTAVALTAVTAAIYVGRTILRKKRGRTPGGKVVRLRPGKHTNRFSRSFKSNRSAKSSNRSPNGGDSARLQPCSLCKKKSARLAYYADGSQVIGVCPACKPKAERRNLLQI